MNDDGLHLKFALLFCSAAWFFITLGLQHFPNDLNKDNPEMPKKKSARIALALILLCRLDTIAEWIYTLISNISK